MGSKKLAKAAAIPSPEPKPSSPLAKCCDCRVEKPSKPDKKGASKLPPKWKRIDDSTYCDKCWRGRFGIRAITIPVGRVVDGDPEEFYKSFYEQSRAVSRLSNWYVRELALRDPGVNSETGKLKAYKKPYLYAEACAQEPSMVPASVQSVTHALDQKYEAVRINSIARCSASHPSYRANQPVPCRPDCYKLSVDKGGSPIVSVRMGDRWWDIALRTKNQQHKLAGFRWLLANPHLRSEIQLIPQVVSQSDHRSHFETRSPGGGARKQNRTMIKLVGWFERKRNESLDGSLYCWTSPDHFLSYKAGLNGIVHHIDAQHVKRWVAEYSSRRQSLSGDLKEERRTKRSMAFGSPKPPMHGDESESRRKRGRICVQMQDRSDIWRKKQKDRIDSFTHEVTAMIAKVAERSKVARVIYDDSDKGWISSFEWHSVKEKLKYKLHMRGVVLDEASVESKPEEPDDDAGDE